MEWDKDEAKRAKEVAEQKMQKGEYRLARNLAEKAQRLFPELENISQLLSVCEVHCSAENKLFGELMDWYKILKIEQMAGEATIKKQYRKLALLLHPDKNKFSGAEAAFKLIGEANRVLADSASRSSYDVRYRAAIKVSAQKNSFHKFNGKTSVSQQGGAVNNFHNASRTQFSGSHHQLQTFWTCCIFCNMRYEYPKCVLLCLLRCQNCQRSFVANDMGAQGMSKSKSPRQNNGSVPNQDPKMASQNGTATKTTKKEAVDVKEEKEDVEKCKSDAPLKPKESGTSRNTKRKRGRQSAVESSKSCDTMDTDSKEGSVFQEKGESPAVQNSVLNEGLERRKSSRKKQGVSYDEKLSEDDDDDFVSSVRNPIESDLSNNNASPTIADCDNENSKAKEEDDASSGPEILEYPDPDFSNFEKDKAKDCFDVDQIWAIYDTNDSMPRFYARVRKVFSPGFKLRITWLEPDPDNEDEIEWCDEELPAACGKFKLGSSQVTEDLPMFSHQITWTKGPGRNCYLIYPRKGEIWALFRNWDISWRIEPEKHTSFKFEIVEVLSDFNGASGIAVAYLGKMKRFVSLFRQTKLQGITLPPRELYRFSHRIPSFKMTGAERKGVPKGSFELDPPSVPSDVDEFCDPGDATEKKSKVDTEVNGSCSKPPENKRKQPVGSKWSSTPKEDHKGETKKCRSPRQQNITKYWTKVDKSQCASKVETDAPLGCSQEESHYDHAQSRRNVTSSKADNTPKRKKKNGTEKETLKSRRSPRALNKKSI